MIEIIVAQISVFYKADSPGIFNLNITWALASGRESSLPKSIYDRPQGKTQRNGHAHCHRSVDA